MSRDKAVTAMVLADTIGAGGMHGRHPMWIHVEGWAAELGMTAPDVLTRTASPPEWAKDGESAQPADPEAGG